MKVIIFSAVAALLLGFAAFLVLRTEQRPVYEAYVGDGARVGDPGHNLVGPDWSGLNAVSSS